MIFYMLRKKGTDFWFKQWNYGWCWTRRMNLPKIWTVLTDAYNALVAHPIARLESIVEHARHWGYEVEIVAYDTHGNEEVII